MKAENVTLGGKGLSQVVTKSQSLFPGLSGAHFCWCFHTACVLRHSTLKGNSGISRVLFKKCQSCFRLSYLPLWEW